MFAVFKTGGKQYRVAAEDVLKIEKVKGEPGEIVEFGEVLVVGGESRDAWRPNSRRRDGCGRSARPIARSEDHRVQEAPAKEFAPQTRPSAGIYAVAHHRDSDRRQEAEPNPAAEAEARCGAQPDADASAARRHRNADTPDGAPAQASKAKGAKARGRRPRRRALHRRASRKRMTGCGDAFVTNPV